MKIIGIEVKRGVFQEKPYENVNIYLEINGNNRTSDMVGTVVHTVRMKKKYFDDLTISLSKNYSEMIGLEVEKIYYDRFGKVSDFKICTD